MPGVEFIQADEASSIALSRKSTYHDSHTPNEELVSNQQFLI